MSPKGKTILIDGGEANQNILLPYLLARKIKTIDFLIISHFDSDHIRRFIRSNGDTSSQTNNYW